MARVLAADESFRAALLDWYATNGREFPWRETRDPYEVLVAELLLQRTRGRTVASAYRTLIETWPTYNELANADVRRLELVIRPLGLSRRAAILRDLAATLVRLGGVPASPEELAALPGVGPYTAHAVAVFALDQNQPVVDWVIARVLRRYFGLPGRKPPNRDPELWRLATRLANGANARDLWLGVIDLADSICKPRPICQACPAHRGCVFGSQNASSLSMAGTA